MTDSKGFSLIEIVVAIGIFAVAVLGTIALMGQTLAFGKYSSNQTIAHNEARRVMENIRRVTDLSGLSALAGTNFNETLSSLPSATVSVTDLSGSPLSNNADPLPVQITVSWSEKGQVKNYILKAKVTQR